MTSLDRLRHDWEAFGATDPLWAVYAKRSAKGAQWDEDDFFATGEEELRSLVSLLSGLSLEAGGDRALDFGCGVGRVTQPLVQLYDRVWGVDIASSMLERARTYNKFPERCQYVLNHRAELSLFESNFFDLVYSNIVLQHMAPNLAMGYIAEFFRILRPNAIAVFSLPSEPRWNAKGAAYRLVPSGLINAYKRRRDDCGATMEMHAVRQGPLMAFLASTGFEVLSVMPSSGAGPNWISYLYCVRKPRDVEGRGAGDGVSPAC